MLPRELTASSATGVQPERHPNSHPPVVAAASAVIVCFPQFATNQRAAGGRSASVRLPARRQATVGHGLLPGNRLAVRVAEAVIQA